MIRNFLRYTLVLGLFLAFPYGSHAEMTKSEIEKTCENIIEDASKAHDDQLKKTQVCKMIESIDGMLQGDTLSQWKSEIEKIRQGFNCENLLAAKPEAKSDNH